MVALDTRLAALAPLQSRHLFAFAVQLLNLPAAATHLLCRLSGILSGVVSHDPVRAVGRHLNPEQTHLVVFREAFDLDHFTPLSCGGIPPQDIYAPIGLRATEVIHLPVVFERTVVHLPQGFDEEHEVCGRLPTIPQHRLNGQPFLVHHIREHLMDMIKLGVAVALGIVETVVNEPKLIGLGIAIDTGHHADTFDDGFGMAAPLPAH